VVAAGLGVSAAPPPDAAVRAGAAAFAAGDWDAAEQLFQAAAERTPDPGLVAFNRAAVAARRGDWRAAEIGYLQALDDADSPPRRRAEALYNRGVCLLHRGGPAAVYRAAVESFARAADRLGDDPLAADARHNLELAKLLWAQARQREKTPPRPGDELPELPPDLPPPAGGSEPDAGGDPQPSPGGARGGGRQQASGRGPQGQPTPDRSPGSGTLPVLADADAPQPLSPADTRAHLQRADERLARERKATARLLAGPDRPNVRDW
jgi:tetratricopeptide (TPR) repeat protein